MAHRADLATRAAPVGVHLGAESLAWLAELYGTSCVTPWEERGEGGLAERAYELVDQSCDFEVWAIHWPIGGVLELHDHGGSSGALYVVGGALVEGAVDGTSRRAHRIGPGSGVAFTPEHVHDVVNPGPQVATSVHIYSPPMEKMTFFTLGPAGLVAARTQHRSAPDWAP